ncbi:MAG: hypothetical protein ABWY51_07030 [Gaiellaceae bacterium]
MTSATARTIGERPENGHLPVYACDRSCAGSVGDVVRTWSNAHLGDDPAGG